MKAAITACCVAAALLLGASSAHATPALFQTVEFRSSSLDLLPKWQQALTQIADEQAVYDACARDAGHCPTRGVMAWQAMIKGQAGQPPMEQLRAANRFLNDWQWKADQDNYGQSDYWASPLEFLTRSGDCEDYAIIKYVTLRRLGFAPEQLRLVVVQDMVRDIAHAVLAAYVDDDVFILDNLTAAVLPQSWVEHYVPYYSVNETTRWAHAAPAETVVAAN